MTLEEELALSWYRDVAPISREHQVFLVQDQRSGKFYVRKTMQVYSREVYETLRQHRIPGTPGIYETAEDGGQLTVIEDYIPGDTLEELLDRGTVFTPAQTARIGVQLCRILEMLHGLEPPVVHRDLKPSNIKLSESGEVTLLDLNAARLCRPGQTRDTVLLGTEGYAAPEQYGFGASGTGADIYALGVLMNVLSTGCLPSQKRAEGRLGKIIAACTELSPSRRYSGAGRVRKALEPLTGKPAPGEDGFPRMKKPRPRWLPPGFRSANPLVWVLSALGYGFLAWVCLTLDTEEYQGFGRILYRIDCLAMVIAMIFFTGNYGNIQLRLLPPARGNRLLRTGEILLGNFLIFTAAAMVASALL